jgi:hypothetical protein
MQRLARQDRRSEITGRMATSHQLTELVLISFVKGKNGVKSPLPDAGFGVWFQTDDRK